MVLLTQIYHIYGMAAKENIRSYIDEKIPWEYEKYLTALEGINKKALEISESTENRREKLQALSLAKECVTTKLDLIKLDYYR